MKEKLLLFFCVVCAQITRAADIFVETESFENKGGWVFDQQFMNLKGRP